MVPALDAAVLPRVLVLSGEIPQTKLAGAILLHRLFAPYPVERLRVLGPRPEPGAELLGCVYRELRMPLSRLEQTRFTLHKRSLAAAALIPLPSHRRVMSLLDGFRPEVVVCVMANTPWMRTAERSAARFGVPLVLIVHDLNEEFEQVFSCARPALFRQNRGVYRSAARRLCVSPEMVSYLGQRYGQTGEVMYPNRSEDLVPRPAEMSLTLRAEAKHSSEHGAWSRAKEDEVATSSLGTGHSSLASPPLTLGYAGSLAYGYGEELLSFIEVLRETGCRLRMFSPRPSGLLDALNHATDCVEICGYRPSVEVWREIQETCDAVILPYSTPAGVRELLYRTHFPSKLTEYLALGMPVVVSGPEFATGVKYARANNRSLGWLEDFSASGILSSSPNGVVACTSRNELVSVLQQMKADGALRSDLSARAVQAGRRDFDPVEIRLGFLRVLAEAVGDFARKERA